MFGDHTTRTLAPVPATAPAPARALVTAEGGVTNNSNLTQSTPETLEGVNRNTIRGPGTTETAAESNNESSSNDAAS